MKNEKRKTEADGKERDFEQEIREYELSIHERKYENRPLRKNIYLRRASGREEQAL
ncbi:MAG: hypothetical protein FWD58_07380 [Firmicutes bacterium]|nr:hypothetical protein [Bacillota bacterium]